jgi:hypothetical protein
VRTHGGEHAKKEDNDSYDNKKQNTPNHSAPFSSLHFDSSFSKIIFIFLRLIVNYFFEIVNLVFF